MTTVLFIHGTGVREPAFTMAFQRIRTGLAGVRPDVTVERCYWGEIGAELRAGGASFPPGFARPGAAVRPPNPAPSGGLPDEEGVPDEEKELARWARLLVDPLYEIRLRQVVDPPRGDLFGRTLEERILALAGQPQVAAELAFRGLTQEFIEATVWVTGSAEFRTVFDHVTADDGPTDAMLSRALVARCLAIAADVNGTELAGPGRDRLVSVVISGFGAADRTLADSLGELAKNIAYRTAGPSLRRRRSELIRLFGDILLYQAQGEAIRTFARNRIRQFTGPVVLLAHSLGGIVAFDMLTEGAADLAQVRMLITVGSQAPLLYELGALSSGIAYPAALPAGFALPWINMYDRRDLLAYAGGELFGGRCRDVPVDTGTPFPTAHSAYWDLDEFYSQLAQVMEGEGL
jgi:pimeloyl-ACP methyl ester carboxylesterase